MNLNVPTKNDTLKGVVGREPFGLFMELDRERNALEQLIERIEFLKDRLSPILVSRLPEKNSTEDVTEKKDESAISEVEDIIQERTDIINTIQRKIDMIIQQLRL